MTSKIDESYDDEQLLRMANEIRDHVNECNVSIGTPSFESELDVISDMAKHLSPSIKLELFSIFEKNMKSYYEITWGWDDEGKKKEMFSPQSHYIIVMNNMDDTRRVAAFLHYQFTWDDEDEPTQGVVYCFELQVESSFQRNGLGKYLMSALKDIAEYWRMSKILLTCFKANINAMQFYIRQGYLVDSSSPSRWGHKDAPYEILSFLTSIASGGR